MPTSCHAEDAARDADEDDRHGGEGGEPSRRRRTVSARSPSPRRARRVRHRRTSPPPHTATTQRWETSATVASATFDPRGCARWWRRTRRRRPRRPAPAAAIAGGPAHGHGQPDDGEHARRGPRRPWRPRRARRRRTASPGPARCRGRPAPAAPRATRAAPTTALTAHEPDERVALGTAAVHEDQEGDPARREQDAGVGEAATDGADHLPRPVVAVAADPAERAGVDLALAHAEHRAAAHGVPVGRDHPVAHDVGAVGQVRLRGRPRPPRRRPGRRRPAPGCRRRRAPARRRGPPRRAR